MHLQSAIGLAVFLGLAWVMSEHRRRVSLRLLCFGLALQLVLGILLLKVPGSGEIFLGFNRVILALEESIQAGTAFVFGYLGGGPAPFEEKVPAYSFILAFRALPLLLLVSALSSLLFYWKVLPLVVNGFSRVLEKTLRLGGAEGLGVSANIFLGMVEAPLFIRPYLGRMTRSELFTVMTSGMATIAGTVMVLYASILSEIIPNVIGHILTASLLNAVAAVIISKIMIPETGPRTSGALVEPEPVSSSMDAITKGTLWGVQLLINIVAMLLVMVALIHLVNLVLGVLPFPGSRPLTLQGLLGIVGAPIVWLMGIPWNQSWTAGELMGTKTAINELVAYINLSQLPPDALSPRSLVIMTYAMCGFANPGSLGIMIGGLGTMAPERRADVVSLGLRAIVAGTLATCMTGALVGLLY